MESCGKRGIEIWKIRIAAVLAQEVARAQARQAALAPRGREPLRCRSRAVRGMRIDDLPELERCLDLHRAAPTRALSIRAKPGVVVGDVVPVLDTAVRFGFEDVSFRA